MHIKVVHILFFLLILISIYFISIGLSYINALSCIDGNYDVYFIKNRVTGSCSYTYTCQYNPLGKNSALLYTSGCAQEEATQSLINIANPKYYNSVNEGLTGCRDYDRPFTKSPEIPCEMLIK